MNSKKNNKGFSLVEMLVTIAILAVVTATSVSIYSWIKANRIKSVTKNIDTAISNTRSETLTKAGTYELVLRGTSDNIVAVLNRTVNGTVKSETKTVGNTASIYCLGTDGNKYYIKKGGTYQLCISFNKSDGSFKRIELLDFSVATPLPIPISNDIYIEYGGLSRRISLKKETGKHSVTSY